ncbi:MAG: hypothetical protein LBO20_05960 [Bifidobacteriaceae bacterium]|jgi:hypothetical protein|nr:hypothetical protein [Bifidobacteriaceae bacterium]
MSELGTVNGEPFTEEMAQALADEAEAGLDPGRFSPAVLPTQAGWASEAVVIRLPASAYRELGPRAAAAHQTRDQWAAKAISELLAANG